MDRLLPEDDDLLNYFLSNDPNENFVNEKANEESKANFNMFHGSHSSAIESMQLLEQYKNPPIENEKVEENDDKDKRQRRLARNRESARQSRRRKKQYLELLEEKVALLTDQIDTVRRKHFDAAFKDLSGKRDCMVESLSKGNVNEEERKVGIEKLMELFGPNGEEIGFLRKYHFEQLDLLLLPAYTKFLLWVSVQENDFFTHVEGGDHKNGSRENVWSLLVAELGLSFDQEERLRSLYLANNNRRSERRRIAIAMSYLNKLRDYLDQQAIALDGNYHKMLQILSPKQAIQYLAWLKENRNEASGLAYFNTKQMDNDKIGAILEKEDASLTVQDITELLSVISTV